MEKSEAIGDYDKFSIFSYFRMLNRMLIEPGQFFSDFSDRVTFRKPLGYLVISGIFFTGASLLQIHEYNLSIAGILFLNAFFMPVITSGITFILTTVSIIKRVKFVKIFSVYAYASSVTLLLSWVPVFIWLTEPWKWLLIYSGLTRGCGLKRMQTILIIGGTVLALVLLFHALGLAIPYIKGLI